MEKQSEDPKGTILNALHGIDQHLAVINCRLDVLLQSNLPEYVKADLQTVHQAERAVSQIVRRLNLFCHNTL